MREVVIEKASKDSLLAALKEAYSNNASVVIPHDFVKWIETDIKSWGFDTEIAQNDLDVASSELEEALDENCGLSNQVEELEAEVERLKERVEELECENQDLRDEAWERENNEDDF